MNEIYQIDEFEVEVRRSNRRRTTELTVDRFGSLLIAVPEDLEQSTIEEVVRRRKTWIYTKLAKKEQVLHPKVEKEYVTGEGFYYLGKKYRLKLFDSDNRYGNVVVLRLKNGRFMLRRDSADDGHDKFVKWYIKRGQEWLANAVELLKNRVAVSPMSLNVRDLKFRWGSCTKNGNVYFHWRVMLLPPKVVHYLIVHELIHLHEHNHSRAFYERLSRAVPDYLEIEEWLEKNGDRYIL